MEQQPLQSLVNGLPVWTGRSLDMPLGGIVQPVVLIKGIGIHRSAWYIDGANAKQELPQVLRIY